MTLGGQPATGATLSGTLTFTGLPQGNRAPVPFGPDDLSSYTGETVTLKVPALPSSAQILIHAVVTLGGQTASAGATYSVAR